MGPNGGPEGGLEAKEVQKGIQKGVQKGFKKEGQIEGSRFCTDPKGILFSLHLDMSYLIWFPLSLKTKSE